VLALVCAVAFWWKLGALGLIDPDEPFYAQTAREMLARGDWCTPYMFGAPQFEKPILFYWLVMGAFEAFGRTEFAARFVPALFASALVALTYLFGRRTFGDRAGFCAGLVLASSLASAALSRFVLTDVVFAFFLTASLASYWMAAEDERRRGLWIAAHFACSGLAVLTKGPLGSIVPLLTVLGFHWRAKNASPLRGGALLAGIAVYAAITVPWYALMLVKYGRAYFETFFIHENWERFIRAEHPSHNHWWYYLAVLAVGSLPWMPHVAIAVARARSHERSPHRAFAGAWLLANLVFLTIAQSKLPSYAYFLFVPMSLLVGESVAALIADGFRSRAERIAFTALGVVQALPMLVAPLVREEVQGRLMGPVLVAGVLMAGAVVLQLRRPSFPGVVMASASVALLIALMSTFAVEEIDGFASMRAVAAKLREDRRAPDEPIVTDRLLARGVLYYTDGPVIVSTGTANPFWTPQPVQMLIGARALDAYIAEHGTALCVFRPGEWEDNKSSASVPTTPVYVGEKVVVRLGAP
jgi:4-amino-4-deoxy-L-arabinose transferase-like glycosyltransferase